MFPWSIAKSAEAMFSQWALKRVLKFLLKKKLGQFIIGDIDLEQLHVQLTAGTIHLSDLALNVDYINQKIGASSAFVVREGSIGSLLITMPWKNSGCRIEVDELELVLAPCLDNISKAESAMCGSFQNKNQYNNHDVGKREYDRVDNVLVNTSMNVHEGVKIIAKMVKWLLTSFTFKVRKLIVALDPCGSERVNKHCRTLVLRITEAECGTCISEDNNSRDNARPEDIFASSEFTNFVKFQGAVFEFLQMDIASNQSPLLYASTTVDEMFSGCQPAKAMTQIVTGEQGGFSGNLRLSIPWKDGSLDMRSVDAKAHLDPLVIKFQPDTIHCLLYLLNIFKDADKKDKVYGDQKATKSIYYNVESCCRSSSSGSSMLGMESFLTTHEKFPVDGSSSLGKETVTDTLLPESHLISDWVPSFVRGTQEERVEKEPDFGASMDQFFECFDELRNSQSALGNSGAWNWTCSVFSAITAASNLASGSLQISAEQQHTETNLTVDISRISLLLSFVDEGQKHPRDCNVNQENNCYPVHYMDAKMEYLHLVLRVHPLEMDFEAKVEHIEVADNYHDRNEDVDLHISDDFYGKEISFIQEKQAAVEGALPSFLSPSKVVDSRKQAESANVPLDGCACTTIRKGIFGNVVIRVTLLRTSGVTQCQFNLKSGSSDNHSKSSTFFLLKLPPIICWVDFGLIGVVCDLLKDVEKSCSGVALDLLSQSTSWEDSSQSLFTTQSPRGSFNGQIFLPKARIILCFPATKCGEFKSYHSWYQFVALDVSSPSTLSETESRTINQNPTSSSKRYASAMSHSLHLNMGDLSVYLVTPASEENVDSIFDEMLNMRFVSHTILVVMRTGHPSVLSMFWQECPITDPWIAKRGKLYASFDKATGRNTVSRKDNEFASATTVNNVKDIETFRMKSQKQMILSSVVFLHAHLHSVTVTMSRSHYEKLHQLMHQVIDSSSCVESDQGARVCSASQVSILMECDAGAISITTEAVESAKGSIQNELPGFWQSMRLEVSKFDLLHVSNVDGVEGANFFSISHGEGNLWGSINELSYKELLLISCSDSIIGRGDGEGSNVLSSRHSGSDIVYSWDPQNYVSNLFVTVRCATMVALGGRLDWMSVLPSFFIVQSPEIEQAACDNLKGSSESDKPCGSFILNLVDVGLSYEPYFDYTEGCHSDLDPCDIGERNCEQNVACLFAASSLKVSSGGTTDSVGENYEIRLKDLGLLLCPVSETWDIGGSYSVGHLRKIGYVKVAQEAHVEALLRMNCENGHPWEVECSESHIILNTCHDTSFGLIRLISQIQGLFTPDLEESIVHLQTRWNNVRQAHKSDKTRSCSSAADNQAHPLSVDTSGSAGGVNIMDEISEDVFHLDRCLDDQADYVYLSETQDSSLRDAESFPHNTFLTGLMPVPGCAECQSSYPPGCNPEFIEGYFLSESSLRNQSSSSTTKFKYRETNNQEVQNRKSGWYGDSSLTVLENHAEVLEKHEPQKLKDAEVPRSHLSDGCAKTEVRLLFKNINVTWKLYAGSDWQSHETPAKDLAICQGRNPTVCLELALSGIEFQLELFPDGEISASRLSLSIQDFQLNDVSKDAPWKLMLGYYQSKRHPRESFSKAFKLDLEAVRPDPSTPLEDYRLRIAFLPMRLHLHQCQLDFLISFFGGMGSSVHQYQSINNNSGLVERQSKKTNPGGRTIIEEALLPYFQKFDIWPVVLRVDYTPCRVDLAALRGGKYVELVNLLPWKGIELHLKHVQAVGIYGWSSIGETIIGEWLEDISQNQVHKLLKGLPPIRSLVAVGSGATKLVSLPLKNYRKDHRLIKGMQRGVISFLRSISLEAIGLGVHLVAGTHEILLQAECILTNISSPPPWPIKSRTSVDVRSNQPKDVRQGIQQAYESIGEGLGKSASAIIKTPMKRYQGGVGVGSAIATAVQAAPAAAIAPASAAARAMHCALLGVRNSLDPEHKKESVDKYLGTSQRQESI